MKQLDEIFELHKVCVLVPTYNNAQTLARILDGVLSFTSHVIVVNDGSTDSTEEILKQFIQVDHVHYTNNRGKGYALRTGFDHARSRGYRYVISIDSDGQHFAEDLPAFAEAIGRHPDSIIIGARNMDQSSVPGKSSFGNKFSNFWFRVETGIRLNDTQSGYRCYPIHRLKDINLFTRKFEFEIEVLVRAAWAGIPITEIPVRVFYPEKSARVSHFRPFRDFSRISVLNTVLVTIAFLYIKPRDLFREIKKKSLAGSCATHYYIPMKLI